MTWEVRNKEINSRCRTFGTPLVCLNLLHSRELYVQQDKTTVHVR